MIPLSRWAISVVCLLSTFHTTANADEGLFVSAFDKPVPETGRDLLTIQRRAIDIAKRVTRCTVGLDVRGAMGSGVVISEDGYILTAAHVVSQPGRRVRVQFPDGRETEAVSLGMHTSADGALLKIKEDGKWPFVPLVRAENGPKIGDWCLAAGHPNGFDIRRAPPIRVGRIVDIKPTVLRTDCPIRGGDSGGPLVDMQGRVIGIHSRITESLTENYHVPGLAIRQAWDALVDSRLYPRPIYSRFLDALDSNDDGKVSPEELNSEYHRRVYWRLVDEFDLDKRQPLTIANIATESFKWRMPTHVAIDEVDDLRDSGAFRLPAADFVRGPRISQVFETNLTSAHAITARIYADGRRVALGTIIDSNGLILTKASRLEHEDIECQLSDGRRMPARVVATHDGYDFALLRIPATDLTVPNWATAAPEPGSWVAIPNTRGRIASLGVLAVASRKIAAPRAILGIEIDRQVVNQALVTKVVNRSGAEEAGIQVGDVMLNVGGSPVAGLKDIQEALRNHGEGSLVRTILRRGDEQLEVDVVLRRIDDLDFLPSDMSQAARRRVERRQLEMKKMEGRRSRRRDGFDSAFQMDAILKPELCGGPIIDATGKTVGITLARANRVTSYGISHEDLEPVIELLRRDATAVNKNTSAGSEVKK